MYSNEAERDNIAEEKPAETHEYEQDKERRNEKTKANVDTWLLTYVLCVS